MKHLILLAMALIFLSIPCPAQSNQSPEILIAPDESSAATFTVTNTTDSGTGSLRQALLDANENPGLDTIVFNIGSGVQTVALSTDLPRITDPVIIDATTQPGYTGNPIIELTRTPGGFSSGFTIDAGNTTIRGFVINNFASGGIAMYNNGGNRIENNFIGTDISGTAARANSGDGILIASSSNNIIGGTSVNVRNLISGNRSAGINIRNAGVSSGSSNNIVQGNYIGTNITGTAPIPNGREGISVAGFGVVASNNLIGGTTAGAGNLISGNGFSEVDISGNLATGNSVQGNLIGTNATGTQAITSTGYGIQISSAASNNVIGGTTANARNVIAGSTFGSSPGGSGIIISEGASANIVQGNFIGTDVSGILPLPNFFDGVVIINGASNNKIGGVLLGESNTIAFNGYRGIVIGNSTSNPTIGNAIRGNSIFLNGRIGIDLLPGDEVNPNDSCDADTGVNNLQNYPVLTSAVSDGTTTNIIGSLNSIANSTFAVDFFVSPTYDNTGKGEGKIYIGSANAATASNCNGDFNVTLPYPAAGGQFVTATATDSNGNTSEFSQYVRAAGTGVKANFDFDGDGRSDISVFRPSDRVWYLLRSASGFTATQFGVSTDKVTPADFDGDGRTDIAVFRDGVWYLQQSQLGFTAVQFGQAGDIPVPFDYTGDGRAEVAVYRSGIWYTLNLATNQFQAVQFGISTDKPVPADYDGDGKTDFAVYRDGVWYWLRSSDNGFRAVQFGIASDAPVVGDYDGDGRADQAVYRSDVWYILASTQGFYAVQFGIASDIPVAADYDGDGKTDIAVYRDGIWYMLRSQQGYSAVQFGNANDKPIPASFVP